MEGQIPCVEPAPTVNDVLWLHNSTYCCCGGRIDGQLSLGPFTYKSKLLSWLQIRWHCWLCKVVVTKVTRPGPVITVRSLSHADPKLLGSGTDQTGHVL